MNKNLGLITVMVKRGRIWTTGCTISYGTLSMMSKSIKTKRPILYVPSVSMCPLPMITGREDELVENKHLSIHNLYLKSNLYSYTGLVSRIYDSMLTMSHFFWVKHNERKTVCEMKEGSKLRLESSAG